jgi:hypothetical protein
VEGNTESMNVDHVHEVNIYIYVDAYLQNTEKEDYAAKGENGDRGITRSLISSGFRFQHGRCQGQE